jgi:hypothetical protein
MEIKNYDVLINEKQASCGLVVDPTEYDISFFKDEFLKYEVDNTLNVIRVYSDKNSISFTNIDERLVYYAYKTETLVILVGGRTGPKHFTYVYEACLA